jgi:hypothetical protein
VRSVRLALAAGFTLVAVALLATLLGSPMSIASTNKVAVLDEPLVEATHATRYCQSGEILPRGTAAVRVWIDATAGPRVHVLVSAHGHTVASGVRGSNWIGSSVTIPVGALARTVSGTTVCVSFPLHDEEVIVQGRASAPAVAAHEDSKPLPGRIWIEYLRPGTRTWLSMAVEVARRMGLGRASAGSWVALAALALMALALALASRRVLEELA